MRKKRYFLPYELDAFANCGPIGNACGLPIEKVSHGNLLLWQFVWRTKNDVVTTGQLIGFFFGVNPSAALVDFGHLEAVEGGWRVKGAGEWLRVMGAQSEAGKRNAKNLKQGQNLPGSPPASTPKSAEAGDKPAGSPPALPATSHQPPATSEKKLAGEKPPAPPKPPKPEKAPDPRFTPLTAALVADYEAIRGSRYKHQGPADGSALKALLAVATDEEIRSRWAKGLRASGWASCSTIAQLGSKWNDLAAPTPQPKGSVIHGQTGWTDADDFATALAGGHP